MNNKNFKYQYDLFIYCSCGWNGFKRELEWFPFSPIDTWSGHDKRNDTNNFINFRRICPKCKESEFLFYRI